MKRFQRVSEGFKRFQRVSVAPEGLVSEGFRRVQEVSEGQNKTTKTETTLKQRVGSLYAQPKHHLRGKRWK